MQAESDCGTSCVSWLLSCGCCNRHSYGSFWYGFMQCAQAALLQCNSLQALQCLFKGKSGVDPLAWNCWQEEEQTINGFSNSYSCLSVGHKLNGTDHDVARSTVLKESRCNGKAIACQYATVRLWRLTVPRPGTMAPDNTASAASAKFNKEYHTCYINHCMLWKV